MPKCKRCGAEIIFILMKSGKYMPVDPEPVAYKEGVGGGIVITPEGERIRGGEPFGYEAADGYGYIPHWATCPYADEFRRQR